MKILMIMLCMIMLSACTTTKEVKATNVKVPPGTEVSFAKVTNPSFAEQYIGADVITECIFYASTISSNYITNSKIPNGHFAFQVTGLDGNLDTNELSGESTGIIVYAPLQYSDMVFGLNRGDTLQLRGGTVVTKISLGSLYGVNNRYIHFKTTSIEKL